MTKARVAIVVGKDVAGSKDLEKFAKSIDPSGLKIGIFGNGTDTITKEKIAEDFKKSPLSKSVISEDSDKEPEEIVVFCIIHGFLESKSAEEKDQKTYKTHDGIDPQELIDIFYEKNNDHPINFGMFSCRGGFYAKHQLLKNPKIGIFFTRASASRVASTKDSIHSIKLMTKSIIEQGLSFEKALKNLVLKDYETFHIYHDGEKIVLNSVGKFSISKMVRMVNESELDKEDKLMVVDRLESSGKKSIDIDDMIKIIPELREEKYKVFINFLEDQLAIKLSSKNFHKSLEKRIKKISKTKIESEKSKSKDKTIEEKQTEAKQAAINIENIFNMIFSYIPNKTQFRTIAAALKSNPELIDKQNKTGFTLLLMAIDWGNYEVAKFLIDNGADCKKVDVNGDYALKMAIEKNNFDLVTMIVGAIFKKDTGIDENPFIIAAMADDVDLVNYLGPEIKNQSESLQKEIFQTAIEADNSEMVRFMIINNLVNIDVYLAQKNESGINPIMQAMINGKFEIAVYFSEIVNDITTENKNKDNALILAAKNGRKEVVNVILDRKEYKSDKNLINAQNKQGLTALHFAVLNQAFNMIESLLVKGAKVDIKDELGATVLDCALESNNPQIIRIFEPYFKTSLPTFINDAFDNKHYGSAAQLIKMGVNILSLKKKIFPLDKKSKKDENIDPKLKDLQNLYFDVEKVENLAGKKLNLETIGEVISILMKHHEYKQIFENTDNKTPLLTRCLNNCKDEEPLLILANNIKYFDFSTFKKDPKKLDNLMIAAFKDINKQNNKKFLIARIVDKLLEDDVQVNLLKYLSGNPKAGDIGEEIEDIMDGIKEQREREVKEKEMETEEKKGSKEDKKEEKKGRRRSVQNINTINFKEKIKSISKYKERKSPKTSVIPEKIEAVDKDKKNKKEQEKS